MDIELLVALTALLISELIALSRTRANGILHFLALCFQALDELTVGELPERPQSQSPSQVLETLEDRVRGSREISRMAETSTTYAFRSRADSQE